MIVRGRKLVYRLAKKKLPNGKTTTLDVIEHPGATLIVPLLDKDTVIMLRQYRAVLGKYLYEFPAGTRDPKEPILRCTRRELEEETNFTSKKITKLGQIYPVPGYSTEIIYIFKAENLTPVIGQPDHDEIIQTIPMKRSVLVRMFKEGKIIDGKTICALAMLGWV